MSRRLLAVALLGTLAAAGCGGGDDKGDGSASSTKASTLHLESQLTRRTRVPADALSGTDMQIRLLSQIYEPEGKGATGRSQATCVRGQSGGGDVYNCDIAFVLPKGTLYGMAVASKDGPPSGAIVGGEGTFAGARGTFEYGTRHGDRLTLTVSLR